MKSRSTFWHALFVAAFILAFFLLQFTPFGTAAILSSSKLPCLYAKAAAFLLGPCGVLRAEAIVASARVALREAGRSAHLL